MDRVALQRETVKKYMLEYAKIRLAHGQFETEPIFDETRDRYALIRIGTDQGKRFHYVIIHVDLKDGKVVIQKDGTGDGGLTDELLDAGIAKNEIIYAFHHAYNLEPAESAV